MGPKAMNAVIFKKAVMDVNIDEIEYALDNRKI